MKITLKRFSSMWRSAALAAALLLAGGFTSVSHAQSSPVGTWDCISSGAGQPGITYLTFSNDFTFSGYTLIAGVPNNPTNDFSERTPEGDVGRQGSATNSSFSVFGFTGVHGPWGFNSKGHVIGFFTEIINATKFQTNPGQVCVSGDVPYVVTNSDGTVDVLASTNVAFCFEGAPFQTNILWDAVSTNGTTNTYVFSFGAIDSSNYVVAIDYVVTNSAGTVFTNATTIIDFSAPPSGATNLTWSAVGSGNATNDYAAPFFIDIGAPIVVAVSGQQTNSISFEGTVVPGKRITLASSTTFGKTTYRGVPFVALPSLSGSWYGKKGQSGQKFAEFFTLTASTVPNIYVMDGQGPGYTYTNGVCVVSKQKKIGFALTEDYGSFTLLRSTFGSFTSNGTKNNGNTQGSIEPLTKISYKATKQ